MFNPPQTLEEAKQLRYGQWAGNERGIPYQEDRCAYRVYGDGWISHQCYRKSGYGPGELYCKQHAKIVT